MKYPWLRTMPMYLGLRYTDKYKRKFTLVEDDDVIHNYVDEHYNRMRRSLKFAGDT